MPSTVTRRPLPALIALLALLLLTALVWWRVSNRDTGGSSAGAAPCPTPSITATTSAAPVTLPPASSIDVQVLNATSRTGLAASVRTSLLADGFRSTLKATNDDTTTYKVTGVGQIRFSAAAKPGALLLQYYFPGAQLLQVTTPAAQVTVSLGPSFKAVQPRQAVAAKLAADHVTLSTAAPTTPAPASGSATASASTHC